MFSRIRCCTVRRHKSSGSTRCRLRPRSAHAVLRPLYVKDGEGEFDQGPPCSRLSKQMLFGYTLLDGWRTNFELSDPILTIHPVHDLNIFGIFPLLCVSKTEVVHQFVGDQSDGTLTLIVESCPSDHQVLGLGSSREGVGSLLSRWCLGPPGSVQLFRPS